MWSMRTYGLRPWIWAHDLGPWTHDLGFWTYDLVLHCQHHMPHEGLARFWVEREEVRDVGGNDLDSMFPAKLICLLAHDSIARNRTSALDVDLLGRPCQQIFQHLALLQVKAPADDLRHLSAAAGSARKAGHPLPAQALLLLLLLGA